MPPLSAASVVVLHIAPGLPLDAWHAVLHTPPAALLLLCYGRGTVPSYGGAMSAFLAKARQCGVALAAVSQVQHGGLSLGDYAASGPLREQQVASGGDMTLEAAYTKLHVLAASGLRGRALEKAFAHALANEFTDR